MEIKRVVGREILDSRGNPTVEVDIELGGGGFGGPRSRRARRPGHAKPSSCATATRAAIWARASARPSRNINGDIATAIVGQSSISATLDKALSSSTARRTRRGSAPTRCSASRWRRCAGHGGRSRRAAVRAHRRAAPCAGRRRAGRSAAGADDEHPERRRARRQQRGLPGVHGDAARRELVCRGAAHRAPRSSTPSAAS